MKSRIDPLRALVDATLDRDDAELVYVNDNHEKFTATFGDLTENAVNGCQPELALDHLLREHEMESNMSAEIGPAAEALG